MALRQDRLEALAAMAERVPPNRVYIKNESGQPKDTEILDADTGEHVDGVVLISILPSSIVLEVALEPLEVAVNDPGYTGPQFNGVKTTKWLYGLRRLEAETW